MSERRVAGATPRSEDSPFVFAHRGGLGLSRRNSLRAFRTALATGVRGLESDIRLTADAVPVLLHGERAGRRVIPAIQAAAVPRWLPSLADLYRTCGTAYELSLDVRDERVDPVVDVARAHDALERLWLCTGSSDRAERWRERHPHVKVVHSVDRLPADVAAHCGRLAAGGVTALNARARRWTPVAVTACHDAGLLAFGWGVHTHRTLRRATAAGCDALYTDWRWLWRHSGQRPPGAR